MEVQQTTCETFTKTLSDVSEKQKGVTENTEKLMSLSNDNLEGVIEIKHTSEETFRTIDELNRELTDALSSVTELSQAAKEIASLSDKSNNEIVEVSSSVDEIIRTTKEIESLAGNSLKMSEETTRVIIEKGIFSTADAVEEMEKIEDSVKGLMETIHTFEQRSKDIEKILAVIKDITEQTGLLSLNAQILAVQAGEYGKSFSVVADEMKVLSEKTSSSTREISRIISTLKTEMKEVVSETKKVVSMIDIGHEKVARTAEALNDIHRSSKKSTDMSSNIVRATKEQTRGIESITVAIERIKQMTSEIKKATSEQEKGVSYILNSIEKIKGIADIVTKTTKEQVESNKYIIQNIELTNKIISEIASASKAQQDVNNNLVVALNQLKNSNMDIHRDLREQTLLLSSLYEEVELLRKELDIFQTEGRK
jgi:methyl-accepting chemotaxis protein